MFQDWSVHVAVRAQPILSIVKAQTSTHTGGTAT